MAQFACGRLIQTWPLFAYGAGALPKCSYAASRLSRAQWLCLQKIHACTLPVVSVASQRTLIKVLVGSLLSVCFD